MSIVIKGSLLQEAAADVDTEKYTRQLSLDRLQRKQQENEQLLDQLPSPSPRTRSGRHLTPSPSRQSSHLSHGEAAAPEAPLAAAPNAHPAPEPMRRSEDSVQREESMQRRVAEDAHLRSHGSGLDSQTGGAQERDSYAHPAAHLNQHSGRQAGSAQRPQWPEPVSTGGARAEMGQGSSFPGNSARNQDWHGPQQTPTAAQPDYEFQGPAGAYATRHRPTTPLHGLLTPQWQQAPGMEAEQYRSGSRPASAMTRRTPTAGAIVAWQATVKLEHRGDTPAFKNMAS